MYAIISPCRDDVHLLSISNDLEWDGESKRIIAVGDGRDKSVFQSKLIDRMLTVRQIWTRFHDGFRIFNW